MQATKVYGEGVRLQNRNQLALVACPEPTETWFPVSHLDVANTAVAKLRDKGYYITNESWVLTGGNHGRMFGVIDISTNLYGDDVTLAVGVRNSIDKSCSMGFCAGSRVHICTNLAFSSEVVAFRKHTLNGVRDFHSQIEDAVSALSAFKTSEYRRYNRWMSTKISHNDRDQFILDALVSGVFPKTMLPDIFREQVRPTFSEFNDGTVWGLFNNFTTAMQQKGVKRPEMLSVMTQRLVGLIESRLYQGLPGLPVIDVTPENN